MKKNNNAPYVTYYSLIFGMGLFLVGTIASFVWFATLMEQGRTEYRILAVALICALVTYIFYTLQKTYRDKVEYDEFGNLRRAKSFSNLSKEERRKIEEVKQIESERLLPTTSLESMTHYGSKTPLEELSKMIGIYSVKNAVNEMAAQLEYDRKFGKNTEDAVWHMCFMGAPGTGKTTVARIMTGLLYQYKIIRKNQYIETNGSLFHGSTPNEASLKTKKILQCASGGVLFIDEAYSLTNGSSNNEAIATLIKEMEDSRDDLVIIFAGYDAEMRKLLDSNPGFKSRIGKYFMFENYTIEELSMIFAKMARDSGYQVSETASDRFKEIIEPKLRMQDFGNGRAVRNCLQESISRHKINCINCKADKIRAAQLLYEDIAYPRSI